MSCKCSKRLRAMLPSLGWKQSGEVWPSPDGEAVHDDYLDDHHAVVALKALWIAGKDKVMKFKPNGRVYFVKDEDYGNEK